MKKTVVSMREKDVFTEAMAFPKMWLSGLILAMLAVALPAYAETNHTWTGLGSTSNWSDAANWTGGLPSDGDGLTFSGTTQQTNYNDLLTSVGTVVISESGFNLSGNAITLNGTFGNTGNNAWGIPLTLTAEGKFFESYIGTLTLSGNITNAGNTVTLKANYAIGADGPIVVSGIVSGSGGLIKDGSGTVTLTRDNTYSGKNTLTQGFLAVSKDSNLGTVPGTAGLNIELNGGYLEATSSFTLNSKRLTKIIASGGDTGFWAVSGVTLTYGGVISAMNTQPTYGLRLDGEGTISLFGTNTYNGSTMIYAYIVKITSGKAFGTYAATPVVVNNLSTLELSGGITMPKPLSLDYSYLVNMSGSNTCSGGLEIAINSSGKSVVSAEAGTTLTLSGSTFINTDTETVPLNGFENLYVAGAGNILISGAIDGDGTDGAGSYLVGHGDVVMDGSGTLTLSGENAYSGRTIVNSGVVSVSSDLNLGAAPAAATAGRIVLNGGTLMGTASFTLDGYRGIALGPTLWAGTGTLQVQTNCVVDYSGIIANNVIGTGSLVKAGSGVLALSGASTYSGTTTISGGTLQLGNGGDTGSLNVNSVITDNGTLAFNQTDTVTEGVEFNGLISGTGGVAQNGSGTVILNSANTYSGPTAVNAGTLLVVNTSGSGTGSGAVTVNNTGTLGGTGTVSGTVTAKSGGTVAPGVDGVGKLLIGSNTVFESGSTYKVEVSPSPDGNVCDKMDILMQGSLALNNGVSILDIGTLSGEGCTIASNVVWTGVTGYFRDTAGNILENNTALHIGGGNTNYYIHYVNDPTGGFVVLNLNSTPNAAEVRLRAYETAEGVVVEFQTIEEAGQNDIVVYLRRAGQWVEVGRQEATGEGNHAYRFVVPGLTAADVVSLMVRDDEGVYHTAYNVAIGSFSAAMVSMDKNGVKLQWDSIPGRTYNVYRTVQLSGPWDVIATVVATQARTETFVPVDPSLPVGFFKIGMRE